MTSAAVERPQRDWQKSAVTTMSTTASVARCAPSLKTTIFSCNATTSCRWSCSVAGRRLELDTIKAAFAPVAAGLSNINHGDWGLLVDMRAAAMRNDEAYERAMGDELARLMSGFRRRALLVKTAVGALQVHRTSRAAWSDDIDSAPEVLCDESEAMQHLHT